MIRIGIIGADSSHAVEFTDLLNADDPLPGLGGARVVAAFPAGSRDLAVSQDRIGEFTRRLRSQGVDIVASLNELWSQVDVVMINSVDGRVHPAQAQAAIEAGKPVFVDKPMANSVDAAAEIFRQAKKQNVPCFSSSALRFYPEIRRLKDSTEIGEFVGCSTYSPCADQLHHPSLFWYGIHGVETLFTLMGSGCRTVSCTRTESTDVVVGTWKNGRVGVFRGLRGSRPAFGATAFGSKGVASANVSIQYLPLVQEILKFFRTSVPPVTSGETLEVLSFLEAANESHLRCGERIELSIEFAI